MGLLQNLSTAQIVEQLVEAKRLLAETGEDITATNIVFMGMGASPSDEKPMWQECAQLDTVSITYYTNLSLLYSCCSCALPPSGCHYFTFAM
jgi:adenine C2-methylase RlmN of 23S rRNA A2503 and tRNA A37